jgi:hypothetical protein
MVAYNFELWIVDEKVDINIDSVYNNEFVLSIVANNIEELNHKALDVIKTIETTNIFLNNSLTLLKYVVDYHIKYFNSFYIIFNYSQYIGGIDLMLHPMPPVNKISFDTNMKKKYYNINLIFDKLRAIGIDIEKPDKSQLEWFKLIPILDYFSKINNYDNEINEKFDGIKGSILEIPELKI